MELHQPDHMIKTPMYIAEKPNHSLDPAAILRLDSD